MHQQVQLQKENKIYKKQLSEYKKGFSILKNKFNEVNLLNSKLSSAMKFLRNPNLNTKQKESIVEAFDRAKSVREVKLVSRTLSEGVKNATVRRPIINAPVRSVASKKINESYNEEFARQRELAGL